MTPKAGRSMSAAQVTSRSACGSTVASHGQATLSKVKAKVYPTPWQGHEAEWRTIRDENPVHNVRRPWVKP